MVPVSLGTPGHITYKRGGGEIKHSFHCIFARWLANYLLSEKSAVSQCNTNVQWYCHTEDSRHRFAILYLTSMKQNTSVTRLRVPHPHTQTVQMWIGDGAAAECNHNQPGFGRIAETIMSWPRYCRWSGCGKSLVQKGYLIKIIDKTNNEMMI